MRPAAEARLQEEAAAPVRERLLVARVLQARLVGRVPQPCRPTNDSSSVTSPAAPRGENVTVGFTIHYAGSIEGPWRSWNVTIPDFRSVDNMNNWNPAPVILPDGRVRVMVHTDPTPWGGETIVEAAHWRGPYRRLTADVMAYCTKCQEDPFMWVDKRGHWHA